MAEVFVEFDSEFKGPDGKLYDARACGRGRDDGLWEGWLEFIPRDGSAAARTGRETTQPNRDDTIYWATGLTATYIDGALSRALTPAPAVPKREVSARPAFDGPADGPTHAPPGVNAVPVLDPFHVYAEGDHILRGQLNALDDGQLRTIIRAHGIASIDKANVATRQELIDLIISAVEKRAA